MNTAHPPKWADRFLSWYCNPRFLEEIQGDAHELYFRRVDEEGISKANLKYIWDVLRFFRWSNIKRSNSKFRSTGMFKNYLKISLRSMVKNWSIATINIVGLSMAIAVAITMFIFIDMQLNMDSFHTNRNNIYQVVSKVKSDNGQITWGDSPILLGENLKDGHSAVKEYTRIEFSSANIRFAEDVFKENIAFVDPSYLEVFDFPIRRGDEKALYKKEQMVISHNMAERFFGKNDPIGEQMSVKFGNGKVVSMVIGGVLDKYPNNASFKLNCLIPMDHYYDQVKDRTFDWGDFTDATFITMQDGRNPRELHDLLVSSQEKQNEADSKWTVLSFDMYSLEGLSLRNHEISSDIAAGGHPAGRIGMGVISGLLLILACFNYMNIAVTSATKRLKEIALRKVMGGVRTQIIKQFLLENMIMVFLALIVGVFLSYYFFMPGFNMMIPITIPFEFSSLTTAVAFFGGMLLLIGLISGSYPAFYISRFQPVYIFKGNQKFGRKNIFSKVLLGFQMFFAFTTIVGCFVFTDNAFYQAERDWGYDKDGIISIAISNEEQYNGLRDAASRNSDIISYSGSYGQIGRFDGLTNVELVDGTSFRSIMYRVEPGYLSTMNIRKASGDYFDIAKGTDQSQPVVVNQKFVEKMGWEDPLNQQFTYDSINRTVIGVVEDFISEGFYDPVRATMFFVGKPKQYNYFVAKTTKENAQKMDEYLAETWASVAPYDPYDRVYQEDVFNSFKTENNANITLMLAISIMAVLLASLGLFGLMSFNIQKRLKEFSVRKVLGATATSIVKVASKQYAWIVMISFCIGAPAGYFSIKQLLNSIYGDPKDIGAAPFVISVLVTFITIAITVSGQALKATRVNPAENLRNE